MCRGLPAPGSLSDEEFERFLVACRDELRQKQKQFERALSECSEWRYQLDPDELTIGKITRGFTVIGTFSALHLSWLWGWANDTFPERTRHASSAIRALEDATGFAVFSTPYVKAPLQHALDLCAVAIHQLEATGLFRIPAEGDSPELFLAVLEKSVRQ